MGETRTGAQITLPITKHNYLVTHDEDITPALRAGAASGAFRTGGPRVVTEATRTAWRQMPHDIQSGEYAKSWTDGYAKGQPWFAAERDRERPHPIEQVGARLRAMMPALDPVELEDPAPI
jgi:ketol-acid reductoisomerase